MAERAAAEAQQAWSRHPSKPAPQAHGPPHTRPEQRQGQPSASLPRYQPSMTAHIQQMPRYRRHCESKPNPEAEVVHAYPRFHIRPRPRSPRTPTAQDYKDFPGPATATSPRDPTTPTHAHSSAKGHDDSRASVDTEPKLNVICADSVVRKQKCVLSMCVQCCAWMCGPR